MAVLALLGWQLGHGTALQPWPCTLSINTVKLIKPYFYQILYNGNSLATPHNTYFTLLTRQHCHLGTDEYDQHHIDNIVVSFIHSLHHSLFYILCPGDQ